MAKVIIPVKDLPPPKSNGYHFFRFRAITKDNNNTSQWSKLYRILSSGQIYPENKTIYITTSSAAIQANWETPNTYSDTVVHNHDDTEKNRHDADIFIAFNVSGSVSTETSSYVYYSRTKENSIRIIPQQFIDAYPEANPTITSASAVYNIGIIVQAPMQNPQINDKFVYIYAIESVTT